MIKLLTNLEADELESQLNNLGPSIEILTIYAINQKHFAWVRISSPKVEKKGSK
jgi:hypothetical protein